MKRFKYLFLLLACLVTHPAFAQEVARGYFAQPDCGTIFGPSPFRIVCLQLDDIGGRTHGNEYTWTGSAWTQYNGGAGASIASAVSFSPAGGLSSTNVQAALQELDSEKLGSGAAASSIAFSPTGNIGSSNLQSALAELDSEKLAATATALKAVELASSPTQCSAGNAPRGVDTFGNSLNCTAITTGDQAASYVWTGVHSWRSNNWNLLDSSDTSKVMKWDLSALSAGITRTYSVPNASTRLLGDSDFSATGIMARTAANTYAGRTLTGTANRITVTNGPGVAGDPTFNLGSLAVQTDQSNTYSTGDQDCGLCASLTWPKATGAAPLLSGRSAYDTTANRFKGGVNGVTKTFAHLDEIQPLSATLTSLSGLTAINNNLAVFSAANTLVLTSLPSCVDSAGQHLNYDTTTHTWSCGTSSTGGLSGLTTGKYLIATGASAAGTTGSLSESGGVINASAGLSINASPFLIFDTSALASSDKTWTILNFSGTIRPSTGAITAGHNLTLDANGLIVDNGSPGTGTWTDASVNAGTNKTLNGEGTGNVLTTTSYTSIDAAGCNNATASTGMDLPTSGAPTPTCFGTTTTQGTLTFADAATTGASRHFRLPSGWTGNVDIDLVWFANAASANAVRWSVATGCKADTESINTGPTYNTASASNTAYTGTANQRKTTSFTAVDATNCAASETMYVQVQRIGANAGDTLTASAELLEVGVKTRKTQN